MTASAALSVSGVRKSFAAAPVLRGIDLEVAAGEVLVLLGPSGCGKTTLLRIIAGLDAQDAGAVGIGGEVVSSDSVHVPTEQRRVGMVFQDGALFPHATVARNVGFGLARPERKKGERIEEMLKLVGLGGFGDRYPDSLSGGQRQRVALARALAPAPRILLMDEPFSNLDAVLRARLRREVRALLDATGITTVFVTHDRDEAFAIADRVAVMADGSLAQTGSPAEVYERPGSSWVAAFVGEANFVSGRIVGTTHEGRLRVATVLGEFDAGIDGVGPGPTDTEVRALVRPHELRLTPIEEGTEGAVATVTHVEYAGGSSAVVLLVEDGSSVSAAVPAATARRVGVIVGRRVRVSRAPDAGSARAFLETHPDVTFDT